MLEFALSGGGLWGVTLSGFLCGLRDRGVIPDVLTSISSGVHAGYLAYSGSDDDSVLRWFQLCRDHMSSRPFRRFLPPYDYEGQAIGEFAWPFLVGPAVFHSIGLQHFLVGYINLKGLRFVSEDILYLDQQSAYRAILRSSTIPFLTNFAPHVGGCIDAGFLRNAFISELPTTERWLITYEGMEWMVSNRHQYQRQIVLPRLSRYPLYASDAELGLGFERGYEIAGRLMLPSVINLRPPSPRRGVSC